jgi:YD repeat-containing protein
VTVSLQTFTYDNNDNLLTASDSVGTVSATDDELDRVKTFANVYGPSLTYTYDGRDRATSVQDSFGATTTSSYDAADRLTRRGISGVTAPLHVELTYTDRGELATESRSKDSGGSTLAGTTSYAYDSAGRLTQIWHKDGSANVLASYVYGFDGLGRVTSATDNGVLKTYGYDATSQLTSEGGVSRTYDATGNRTGGSYSTGTANQLSSDGTWTYTYDDRGQLTKKSKGASAETWLYTYDNAGMMLSAKQEATDGGTVQARATYVDDVLGERVQKSVWTLSSGLTTVTRFVYDVDGQEFAETDGSNNLQLRRLYLDGTNQVVARLSASDSNWYLNDYQLVTHAAPTVTIRLTNRATKTAVSKDMRILSPSET